MSNETEQFYMKPVKQNEWPHSSRRNLWWACALSTIHVTLFYLFDKEISKERIHHKSLCLKSFAETHRDGLTIEEIVKLYKQFGATTTHFKRRFKNVDQFESFIIGVLEQSTPICAIEDDHAFAVIEYQEGFFTIMESSDIHSDYSDLTADELFCVWENRGGYTQGLIIGQSDSNYAAPKERKRKTEGLPRRILS